jgi:predicted DNA-binding transcriptional regulator YafY
MSNLKRLQWIDAQIRNGKYPNCRIVSEHFELSSRQAARDMEYLRDSMGAPLQYDASHNGYYYIKPSFVLPAHIISEGGDNLPKYQ